MQLTVDVQTALQIDIPTQMGAAESWQRSTASASLGEHGVVSLAWSDQIGQFVVESPWSPPARFENWAPAFGAFLALVKSTIGSAIDRQAADEVPAARADARRRRDEQAAREAEALASDEEGRQTAHAEAEGHTLEHAHA